jgi:hypothetical protein
VQAKRHKPPRGWPALHAHTQTRTHLTLPDLLAGACPNACTSARAGPSSGARAAHTGSLGLRASVYPAAAVPRAPFPLPAPPHMTTTDEYSGCAVSPPGPTRPAAETEAAVRRIARSWNEHAQGAVRGGKGRGGSRGAGTRMQLPRPRVTTRPQSPRHTRLAPNHRAAHQRTTVLHGCISGLRKGGGETGTEAASACTRTRHAPRHSTGAGTRLRPQAPRPVAAGSAVPTPRPGKPGHH